MKNSELYYAELKKLIRNEQKMPAQQGLLNKADRKCHVYSKKQIVRPLEDWIIMAENCMPSLRSAVSQSRRRLYNDIIKEPLELVRKVSPETVRELSKHSEILKESSSGIMPDALFVPINDEDFDVYDNRFLYTVILTLKNFIHSALSEAEKGEKGIDRLDFELNYGSKENGMGIKAEYYSSASYFDGRYSDPLFSRIDAISVEIEELLQTELLSRFDDNDMLELPINPTNAILMDPDFVCANELLDYLTEYKKTPLTFEDVEIDDTDTGLECFSELEAIIPLISAICESQTGGIKPDENNFSDDSDKSVYELIESGIPLSDRQLKQAVEELRAGFNKEQDELCARLNKQTERLLKLRDEQFNAERQEYESRIRALEVSLGRVTDDDYRSEENFLILEKEKDLFDNFYNRNLAKMKRKARKKYVWDVLFMGKMPSQCKEEIPQRKRKSKRTDKKED